MNNISNETLYQKLPLPDTAVLLDVREIDEYQEGHIPEAINMPLSTLTETYQQLDPKKTYYIICLSGMRSLNASQWLVEHGFQDVYNVTGGMSQWQGPIE